MMLSRSIVIWKKEAKHASSQMCMQVKCLIFPGEKVEMDGIQALEEDLR